MDQHTWTPPRTQHVCYEPAEFTLRLDEPRPRFGRQEYLHKATTSFGVRADTPQFSLDVQDTHGRVRFVLDNSTAVRGGERNITIDITADMDDWNAFRGDMVVCRRSPWVTAASRIYSKVRSLFMWENPVR